MRLVLSLTDLVDVLAVHLGRNIELSNVRVLPADELRGGFELEIDGAIGVSDLKNRPLSAPVADNTDTAFTYRESDTESLGGGMSMSELLKHSREIEEGINALKGRR